MPGYYNPIAKQIHKGGKKNYLPRTLANRLNTLSALRNLHCHTVITRHPSFRSALAIRMSLLRFSSIFLFQNAPFVFGSLALLQFV